MTRSTSVLLVGLAWLAASTASPADAAGDRVAGAALVKARCQMCHAVTKGQKSVVGPNLGGIAGRKAGSADFAQFSPALKETKMTWNAARLDQFLQAPGKMIPGTKMVISVPDATERTDIVAFLVSNK